MPFNFVVIRLYCHIAIIMFINNYKSGLIVKMYTNQYELLLSKLLSSLFFSGRHICNKLKTHNAISLFFVYCLNSAQPPNHYPVHPGFKFCKGRHYFYQFDCVFVMYKKIHLKNRTLSVACIFNC